MSLQTYHGRCHCGAVRFTLSAPAITRGLRCTCSICRRKGALMSPQAYAPEQLQIDAAPGALACYRFNSGVAEHYFCRECGIYPFHATVRQPGYYRVNLGCIDSLDPRALECDWFDGATLIPEVSPAN